MEPKILIVGRNLDVMDILKSELSKFGRNIVSANSNELIAESLSNKDIDLIVVGAGLPDKTREEMRKKIMEIQPSVSLFMIERKKDSNPAKMIEFTNEKAVLWKIEQILGPMPKKA